jgi:hypothetical protein
VKKVGVLVFKKERLNSRQPNYDGRAYDGALVYRCNLEPNESLDDCRLRVQLLRRVQLLGPIRYHACEDGKSVCIGAPVVEG